MRTSSFAALALCAAIARPTLAQEALYAVWGPGPAELWAVGDGGSARHFSGGSWSDVPLNTTATLRALWGSSARDVWAVGDGGAIVHWNGSAWAPAQSGTTKDLIGLAGCSANDVYAVAQSSDEREAPAVIHWNGRAWSAQPMTVSFRAAGVAAACPGIVVAGATYFDPTPSQRRRVGVVSRSSGGAWTTTGWNGQRVTDPTTGGASWSHVSAGGGHVLLMGLNDKDERVILLQRAGAWTRIAAPADLPEGANLDRATLLLSRDGTPVLVFESSFARWVNGAWQTVAPRVDANGQAEQMARTMRDMHLQAGQMPTADQMKQIQQMQQAVVANAQNAGAMAQRVMAMRFGEHPAVWAPTGASIYVATENGRVVHITGDDAAVMLDPLCRNPAMSSLPQCSQAASAGGPPPASSLPTPTRRPKSSKP